jgi:hypothetical protein
LRTIDEVDAPCPARRIVRTSWLGQLSGFEIRKISKVGAVAFGAKTSAMLMRLVFPHLGFREPFPGLCTVVHCELPATQFLTVILSKRVHPVSSFVETLLRPRLWQSVGKSIVAGRMSEFIAIFAWRTAISLPTASSFIYEKLT